MAAAPGTPEVFEVLGAMLASGVDVGVEVWVDPGDVVAVLVGAGRDVVGDGVVAGFVGVLLWDGEGECVRE